LQQLTPLHNCIFLWVQTTWYSPHHCWSREFIVCLQKFVSYKDWGFQFCVHVNFVFICVGKLFTSINTKEHLVYFFVVVSECLCWHFHPKHCTPKLQTSSYDSSRGGGIKEATKMYPTLTSIPSILSPSSNRVFKNIVCGLKVVHLALLWLLEFPYKK
jgi:hypothetical protein